MPLINELLERVREESDEENFPSVSEERGKFLRDLVAKYKPERILEVGSGIGYSTLWMASVLPSGAKIVTVEINPQNAHRTAHHLEKAGVGDRVQVTTGDALQILPNLPGPFDFVFLDAVKSDYLRYLQDVEPQLSLRAVIVADNAGRFPDEMGQYLRYVRNSEAYESTTHEFRDDKMEVSIKK